MPGRPHLITREHRLIAELCDALGITDERLVASQFGHDQFGGWSIELHVVAQELPDEQVGGRHERCEAALASCAFEPACEGREGRVHPMAVVGAASICHLAHGGYALLLGKEPKDRRAVALVAVEQHTDRLLYLSDRRCLALGDLARAPP